MVPDTDPLVSSEDSEGCPVAAADPGGAELCSLAPLEVSPLAPVEDLFERSLSAGEFRRCDALEHCRSEVGISVSRRAALLPNQRL